MEQHPIPQQISSYQFRLVGDMTLKQFFQVGGGALVSLLIYATGLHPVIKWPLILFSFSLGGALAFLPLEERPLSRWLFAFFRSVYSPTIYFWQRQKSYVFFQEEAIVPKDKGVIAPHGEAALDAYLKALPEEKAGFFARLENAEKNLLLTFSNLFTPLSKPLPLTPPIPVSQPKSADDKPPAKTKPLSVPSNKPVSIASKGFRPNIVIEEKLAEITVPRTQEGVLTAVSPTLTGSTVSSRQAQYSESATPPIPPSIPNTVSGQVLDINGKILDGAILEIRDLAGRPVRALRSNKVGHFLIVTSLQNGQYDIITEKDGYQFDPVTFEAKGEIIPPILINAQNSLSPLEIAADQNSNSIKPNLVN